MAGPKSARAHITVSLVRKLKPNSILWDADKLRSDGTVLREGVRGFGCRRQRSEARTYFLCYRLHGRQRWLTIGRHGDYTPDQARERAARLRGQIADAKLLPLDEASQLDPATIRDEAKRVPTVADVVAEYLDGHVETKLKPVTAAHYRSTFENIVLPAIGQRRLDSVTRGDMERLHRDSVKMPFKANRALAIASSFFSWCENTSRRTRGSKPCVGIKRYREAGRERFLSGEELQRLGQALIEAETEGAEDIYTIAFVRLLLLTGARKSEIQHVRWQDINFENSFIDLPDSKTGRRQLFLSAPAKAILASLPSVVGNPYCIVGSKSGSCRVNVERPWRRIRERAGLDGVRLHDLRHSYASLAAADGQSLQVISRLLGHAKADMSERYAHLAADPIRQANERIGKLLEAAMSPETKAGNGKRKGKTKAGANVVKLKHRAERGAVGS